MISDKLKRLRTDCGITLEEAGKAVGLSKQNLYKYENGVITNIPSNKIEALAELYRVSPAYIMGWEDKKNNPAIENQPKEQSSTPDVQELVKSYLLCSNEDKEELLMIAKHKSQKNIHEEKGINIA